MRIIGLLLLLVSGVAFGATTTVTWQNATNRVDGSALAPSEIANTKVRWGTCDAGGDGYGTTIGTGTAQGAANSLTTPDLPAGTYCYQAAHVTVGGATSAWSTTVQKVVTGPESPPQPPLIVTVSTLAYQFEKKSGSNLRLARASGVVIPLGTPCQALIPGLEPYGIAGDYVALCK